ncbi:MAG TPA: hypothetical protein PLE99_00670 [Candidatus Thiothrix moscowensis]|uniref:hypothetical protein n=1 Tax=unclassified Thiothrix TaxID=2636184 RepID=UPI0025DF714A|nr:MULTISPECIES: hypothetical protein [unclassified Thiothrix]HRJ51248.1 hypothetical protein [Candidatus Thiothrix moscowensis]HRJ91697.1 hypothetical protein [Candidatus Thiothrix moscowensis]
MTKPTLLGLVLLLSGMASSILLADDTAPAAAAPEEVAVEADTAGKLKVESIRVEDNYGTVEEERVQAMRSEIRYVPAGSTDGYHLISSEGSEGKIRNAHREDDMLIPSWKLFTW